MDGKPNVSNAQGFSSLSVLALSFGCIIGWGSFYMPGMSFLPDAGPIGSLIAFFIGTVFFFIIAKTYAYAITQHPNNGGAYGIVNHVLDKPHAFLTVWSLIFAYYSLLCVNMINFAPFARHFFGDALQWGFNYSVGGFDIYLGEILTELFILGFFGLIIAYGKRLGSILLSCFFIVLFVSVVTLFIGILVQTDISTLFIPAFASDHPIPLQIYNVLLFVPWMFVGFGSVSFKSNEFSFPIKKINFIMPLAIVLGALDYAMLNIIGATAIPDGFQNNADYIQNLQSLSGVSSFPVLYAVQDKLGTPGVVLLGTAIFCALSSSIIGFYQVLINMIKSLADEKLLPKFFGTVNKNNIPTKAILLILLLALTMAFIGKTVIGWLTDATSISATIAYAYISYCSYAIAKKTGNATQSRFAIASLIISILFFVFPLMTSMFFENVFATESYFILAIWGILGYSITVYISGDYKRAIHD